MFCPKCGVKNPEEGTFCRSCGTDLGNVSNALSPKPQTPLVNKKGRTISWEGTIRKLAIGLAFFTIAIYLGFSNMAGGKFWWFWLLIPAFTLTGSGVAQFIQLKKRGNSLSDHHPNERQNSLGGNVGTALPPKQTEWVSPESTFKTGDLVPPSVTENTTRHLEMDPEGQTMALKEK